jgi:hypothetical protein
MLKYEKLNTQKKSRIDVLWLKAQISSLIELMFYGDINYHIIIL